MGDDLLANVQDIAAQLVDAQIHGHRIRAEQVEDLLIDISEVRIRRETLIDISELAQLALTLMIEHGHVAS